MKNTQQPSGMPTQKYVPFQDWATTKFTERAKQRITSLTLPRIEPPSPA